MIRTLVVMEKRKIFLSLALLLGVIAPLMAVSYFVPVEEVTGPPVKWLKYSSERQGFNFNYPEEWLLRTERDFGGGEVLESVSFMSPDKQTHGFVQVMQLNKPVPEYIAKSKKVMVPGYDSFQFTTRTVGSKKGYFLGYKRGQGEARAVAEEYFFPVGGRVVRFSCFYPEILKDQYEKTFGDMLESLVLPVETYGIIMLTG